MKIRLFAVLMLLIMMSVITYAQDKNPSEDENAIKIRKTMTLIKNLEQPLMEYASKHPYGKFPEASEEEEGNGTVTLVEHLREGNFYEFSDENLSESEPYQLVDAWGVPMRYHPWKGTKPKDSAHNKKSYDLWSAGPDNDFGEEEDNITNWSRILGDNEDAEELIKNLFESYFKAINAYETEKSIEFYYVPKNKEAEFKQSLQSQMDAMKKIYGDQEFIRNFQIIDLIINEDVAELKYSSEFYLTEDKKWSKSENTLTLVKIDGNWKIDIYGVYKINSVEEKWVSVSYAMQSIIDAIEGFKKDSGSLDVLATDVWKPISHIMGAIKLDSEILTGLTYFDLEDFHYITRKIDGVYHYRLICIAWGNTKGGTSGEGPQVGYKVYDSEKNEYFEDFKANSFDGLGKAKVEKTDKPSIEDKKVEIDEEVKTEITKVVDGFFNSVNKFDSKGIQEFIYIQEYLREKAVARLNELFELMKKEGLDKDGSYLKDWEILDLKIEGSYGEVLMRYSVFFKGTWNPDNKKYQLVKVDGKWLINFFGLNPEDQKPQTKPDDEGKLNPDNPIHSKIVKDIDEYYNSFNALDAERVYKCIYMPEDKKEQCIENINIVLKSMRDLKVPEGYSLFKEWIVEGIEIDGNIANVSVKVKVFQDVESGYYEDYTTWLCVKVGDKWVVDLFRYSDKELTEEEWLRNELQKLEQENEGLRKKVENLQKQNKNLRAKNKNLKEQNKKLKSEKSDAKKPDKVDKSTKAKIAAAKASVKSLYNATERYKLIVGNYPETLEELITGPDDYEDTWHSLVIGENGFKDPWGNKYVLEYDENGEPCIICYGADGKEGGEGVNADLYYPAESEDEED